MKTQKILKEVCCDSLDKVIYAARNGADRIELCADLGCDGLTPGLETFAEARKIFAGPINVLIRLRDGNFVYTSDEIEEMCLSIDDFGDADGYVLGALTPDGNVDTEAVKRMMDHCQGKPVTFHRAFDRVADPLRALEDVIGCGCARILTSGCKPTAIEGVALLTELKKKSAGRIKIMAGGAVRPENIKLIIEAADPDEIHGTKLF